MVSQSKNMHVPFLGYANKNQSTSPKNVNFVCYNCNRIGHTSYECRKKNMHSYGNQWINHAQCERSYRGYEQHRTSWNERRNIPAQSRNSRNLVTSQNGIVKKGRANLYVRRFPNHEVRMDDLCYYSTTSSCDVEFGSARINQHEKKKPSP